MKIRKLIQYFILLVLAFLLTAGAHWANQRAGEDVCEGVDVYILNSDSTVFVTKSGILKELEVKHIKPIGQKLSKINTEKIEDALSASEYLENVECVIVNNRLRIEATQMIPVMRIFDGPNSYYVNCRGKSMSATARYHVDVPVVQGHFPMRNGQFCGRFTPLSLLPMVQYVEGNKLLRSLVTMYTVKDSSDIFIVPSIYGHVVNMGHVSGYEEKFKKLLKFYREVMPVKGWMTYDTISVKWDYQVVATRRLKAAPEEIAYNPDEDEQAPDLATIEVPDRPNAKGMRTDPDQTEDAISSIRPSSEEDKADKKEESKVKEKTQKKQETKSAEKDNKATTAKNKAKEVKTSPKTAPKKTTTKAADAKKADVKKKTSDTKKVDKKAETKSNKKKTKK